MTTRSPWSAALGGALLLLLLTARAGAAQQTPTMPSTQRYGSGLLDIPVSSVLPHLNIRGTYSGFYVNLDRRVQTDASGNPTGFTGPSSGFFSDAALSIGLLDRFETGLSLQSFGGASEGGDVWGLFGRVRLWEPIDQGIGLAAGARYLTSPDFGDGRGYFPARLGFPDERFGKQLTGGTNLSLYGVATAYVRGFDGGFIPRNDLTFTLGYGGGMFREGGRLGFYGPGHSNGWFYGTSVHLDMGEARVLSLMAEHNGFDVNVGAQFDWEGYRLGLNYLASNHAAPTGGYNSEYQKAKFGVLLSVSVCPTRRGLRCPPNLMRRTEPDTIFIPPPPPDTVVVNLGAVPTVPEGEPATLCLATGRNAPVLITAQGDTLVGPDAVSIEALRPLVDFAGSYARGALWFEDGGPIVFEGLNYGKSDDAFPVDCDQMLRVGIHEGVPVFADRAAERPLVVIFVPVRPGLWQRYERGLP